MKLFLEEEARSAKNYIFRIYWSIYILGIDEEEEIDFDEESINNYKPTLLSRKTVQPPRKQNQIKPDQNKIFGYFINIKFSIMTLMF